MGILLKDQSVVRVPMLQFSAGFTLVEILIVLMILGIVGMMGLPALNSSLEDARLRESADDIVTALEYAQLTAMTTGKDTNVTILASSEKISVKYDKTDVNQLFTGGNVLPEGIVENGTNTFMYFPLNKGIDYEIELKKKGIDIVTTDFHSSSPVSFDARGSPSHGGSATVALGNRWIRVNLDALTGKVSVSK